MQISYISVKNFRGIRTLNTSFNSRFICLIGSGDSCKTTILTAVEYALTQRWNINFDDSDFYDQNVSEPITISVSLTDWDNDNVEIRKFFQETKFGQYIGGLTEQGPIDEPIENTKPCITIQLVVTNSLEPAWHIVKGSDSKHISSSERIVFAMGRIDSHLDNNFTWGRNTFLTKLSAGNGENLNVVLSNIARITKNNKIDLDGCNLIAKNIQIESIKMGVNLNLVSPKIDIQKVSLAAGALSLHEAEVPLRNFGAGSKKLISCAIQSQLNQGSNITLIDELETGLEPHRIRGLIKTLKSNNQQIITSTHSPVVLRELVVTNNELYICRSDKEGAVSISAVNEIPDLQACVRSNPEAFLGRTIIVCEGPTEIGCLRALDEIKSKNSIPVWTLNTSYYNAGGVGNIKSTAIKLKNLGYQVMVFCDNDTPTQFSEKDETELEGQQIPVINWQTNFSIESQLFNDLRWTAIPGFFEVLATAKEKSINSIIQSTCDKIPQLSHECEKWLESDFLRKNLGLIAGGKNLDGTNNDDWPSWFKRIDLAEEVFKYCIPNLKEKSTMTTKLDRLWSLIQK